MITIFTLLLKEAVQQGQSDFPAIAAWQSNNACKKNLTTYTLQGLKIIFEDLGKNEKQMASSI